MIKNNDGLLLQFAAVTYFTLNLALYPLNPLTRLSANPTEQTCLAITADPFTEKGNAMYSHLLQ